MSVGPVYPKKYFFNFIDFVFQVKKMKNYFSA